MNVFTVKQPPRPMKKLGLLFCFAALSCSAIGNVSAEEVPDTAPEFDIVVYGATSGGLIAGIKARQMGYSAVVIHPDHHIGGLTTGGLGQTDIGNKDVIGGLSREFYRRVAKHYADESAWRWQRPSEYRSEGQSRTEAGEEAMWTFEPSVASKIFRDWIAAADVTLWIDKPLQRAAVNQPLPADAIGTPRCGVVYDGLRIAAIRLRDGTMVRGKIFIDATYTGDLLAEAGIPYTVGRESNDAFDETVNGNQPDDYSDTLVSGRSLNAANHQLNRGIDPYVTPGVPDSGVLPGIEVVGDHPAGIGVFGQGDRRVQAYCFRGCYTDHPENRIPFSKPEGYREEDYELLFRHFEVGGPSTFWKNDPMPNRKTDTNNNGGFSSDYIGQNWNYPEASYEERRQIEAEHRRYQQGLMWSLANHPRVPESIRREVSRWGTCRDEFTLPGEPGGGWQHEIYVREGRRMLSDFVMTQSYCERIEVVPDSIGHAAYGMDSHHVRRYVTPEGFVRNEGNVQARVTAPYRIGYQAICPPKNRCQNLLVPVCLSSTHVAYGSIRMEPVFMVLGQSAATAAAEAIESGRSVQDVDYAKLAARLQADGQILAIDRSEKRDFAKEPAPIRLTDLAGVVADDDAAKLSGEWTVSNANLPRIGDSYLHEGNKPQQAATATWTIPLPQSGRYEVRLSWPPNANRASNALVKIISDDRTTERRVDQRRSGEGADPFHSLGVFTFAKQAIVEVSNAGADGHVIVDAIQLLPADTP